MISVKVLGTGCKKCQTLEAKVRDLVATNQIDATVEKVYGHSGDGELRYNDDTRSYYK